MHAWTQRDWWFLLDPVQFGRFPILRTGRRRDICELRLYNVNGRSGRPDVGDENVRCYGRYISRALIEIGARAKRGFRLNSVQRNTNFSNLRILCGNHKITTVLRGRKGATWILNLYSVVKRKRDLLGFATVEIWRCINDAMDSCRALVDHCHFLRKKRPPWQ